jgi:hypothetical protein
MLLSQAAAPQISAIGTGLASRWGMRVANTHDTPLLLMGFPLLIGWSM